MSEAKGTISTNDLMQRLVQAKKVMDKVQTGSFEKGNIDESLITLPSEETSQNIPTRKPNLKSTNPPSIEKIQQSKLPDAIKKAMIENPIPQITLNDGIDLDLVKGAKKLMEREGMITKKQTSNGSSTNTVASINQTDLISALTPIIENVVRKVMDEKLNQILTASQTQSMNENLVLKVGDSIFKGKITGVNKSK